MTRITINLKGKTADQLDELIKWTELDKTDLINRAIALYHFVELSGAKVMTDDREVKLL
jgi:Ribbon-helix-helix protein, copG family.